ncbi:MAG: hypothetical protein AAF497_25645 [Planctomycetota bacterium]
MSTYQFWRPSLLAALIGVCVIGFCSLFLRSSTADPIRQAGILADLTFPSPTIKPEDVVRIQVEAMRAESQGLGALQCYCFAAPSNRVVTGPVDRFAQLIRNPPYDSIGESETYSIGGAEIDGDISRTTVVVVGKDQQVRVFSWVLRKQVAVPYESCWMTVGVFVLHDAPSVPALPQGTEV